MSNWILNLIAWDYNKRQLKQLNPIVKEINHLYDHMHDMSDDEIKAKTDEFKQRYQSGESLDTILPEAFAVVKQAAHRMSLAGHTAEIKGTTEVWNMTHYDVQLLGWVVLHRGMIAEMRTWEGKTLVASLAVYLNAITAKGVHVVTVNDYLTARDGERMWELYKRLWLTVGIVHKQTPHSIRREQYSCDVTYVENSELGFDYLRDNLAKTMEERAMLWRPLHYAIVDEADSILIDEARTPMIISQASGEATDKYAYYSKLVGLLTPSKSKKKVSKGFLKELLKEKDEEEEIDDTGDYYIDEKLKTVTLSSAGIAKLEWLLKVENLYRDLGYTEIHHIENALKAHAVYHRDKEYLIKDDEVMIVDDHTGRVMPGRRYSQWLHQAIEAKENVKINQESKTLASITYQNFFALYEKVSGMTGTATTEAEEFENIYKLETLSIPTNKDVIRVDKNDAVYFNQTAKRNAVVEHIKFYHEIGLPILIGTSSIQTSELVSNILSKMNYPHTVLNAKFHEQEANIIANAGKKWSLVVATNMAGRGTDIKLQVGLKQEQAQAYIRRMESQLSHKEPKIVSYTLYSSTEYEILADAMIQWLWCDSNTWETGYKDWITHTHYSFKIKWNNSKKEINDPLVEIMIKDTDKTDHTLIAKDAHFGLFILGTEKHDSRRIDNQLRGRAWRQWDPGVSQFFVAFDDEIMRKMWGDKIQTIARMMMKQEELEQTVFTQSQFTNSIARAQKQMEARHFSTRKHLFEYDSVLNAQRQKIYRKRDEILRNQRSEIWDQKVENTDDQQIIETNAIDEILSFIPEVVHNIIKRDLGIAETIETFTQLTGVAIAEDELVDLKPAMLSEKLQTLMHDAYHIKTATLDQAKLEDYISKAYLRVMDKHWMTHIDDMQHLREKVSLFGYAQIDPLVMYKKEAYEKFESLQFLIKQESVSLVLKTDYTQALWTQQQDIKIDLSAARNEQDMMQLLQELTKWVDMHAVQQLLKPQTANNLQKLATDDIEIFELDTAPSTTTSTNTLDPKDLRPNDKVNIVYPDGRRSYDVKWKKVEQEVMSGKAKLM